MPARQTCPASSYWPAAFAAAASRSASANTSSGPLPPSSPVKGTMFFAAACPMWRAVSGEPVNETRRTPGCETRAAPASSPMPCTTLKTPGGKPASTVRSASSEADSGDHSAGLRTTVQPAARPGAHFQVESMNGAFHGRDDGRRAARHAQHAVAGAVRLPLAPGVGRGEVGVGAEVARPAGDHARLQRAQQHRHVLALDGGKPLDVGVDQVGEAVQVLGAARGAERGPGGERVLRGPHGVVDVVRGRRARPPPAGARRSASGRGSGRRTPRARRRCR